MEWTPPRIRRFRDVGLCQSQHDFAKTLGLGKRTIGNAERGAHPPGLALRRALDQALERASDIQRARFLAAEDQSIASPAHGTFPALRVTAAASLRTFPVTSYADTAYLEAIQQHIWQIVETTMRQIGAMVGDVASTRTEVLLARILPELQREHVPGSTRETAEQLALLLSQANT